MPTHRMRQRRDEWGTQFFISKGSWVPVSPGYRIYFGKDGERLVILFGGGSKRRQQADIEAAKRLWSEYKRRKGEDRDATHT
jgi:hypothetical protein